MSGGFFFAEEDGLGYLMSESGVHQKTIELSTGKVLQTFDYDQNSRLSSITDRFGNRTTIERDGNGAPTAIVSPYGIRTELALSAAYHLTRVTRSDGSHYDFEYTSGGLLRFKTEPNGNRYEHRFDPETRTLTDVLDEEGGSWHYSSSLQQNGDILSSSTTGEGNTTSYLDHTDSSGAYNSQITAPTGAVTVFSQSADGFSVAKSLPCGMNLGFGYSLDSRYKFLYLSRSTEKTPSGITRTTQRVKTYRDTDSDNLPDQTTEKVTVNGKEATLLTDTLRSKKTFTSAAGRAVTLSFDPSTLLTTDMTIPGLNDTAFGYDAKGRLISISTDTRQTAFTYSAQGNLTSVTDPEYHTTTYVYDPLERVIAIIHPDNSSDELSYDLNGNMTVLTNPSNIDHTFGYNHVNLGSSYITPQSGHYAYTYDRDRRLTQIQLPSGKQIRNIYDKTNLVSTEAPEGNINLTYLCSTKVGSITNGAETLTYGYDGPLVTSEILKGTLNQTLSYAYNSDFNPTSFTYAGASVTYAYDNDNLLTQSGVFTINRDSTNGLPQSVTGGALRISRTFNGFGEFSSQTVTIQLVSRAPASEARQAS